MTLKGKFVGLVMTSIFNIPNLKLFDGRVQEFRHVDRQSGSQRRGRIERQTTKGRLASAVGKRGYADAFNAGRAAGQNGSERPRALRN